MLKKFTTLFFSISLFIISLKGECVLVPLSLKERVDAASLIVEIKVIGNQSYWNSDKTMIYTANTVAVSKVFKGANILPANSFNVITLGGVVGDKAVKVDPELELAAGEIGILLLVQKNGEWVSESGPQGFIKIDKVDGTASDVFNQYAAFSITNKIESLIGAKAIDINVALTKILISSKRATCTISSISPKTMSAGTTSTLTIKGTNFKSVRDTSSVQFKNADDGGASYTKALQLDYISWNDTMIKLIVRSQAGTGKIRVVVGGNGNAISSDTLKITYAHLNVITGYKRDSVGYETQEIGMNGSGGITWKMSTRFYDSVGARGAFVRSLERWRCGTYINWDTLGKVKYNKIASDGVNICAWDTSGAMGNGVLAQCFSFWSGCYTPGLVWYVNELDIRFRVRPTNTTNWNYTTGSATLSQFHFESVAVHELGHGHQMGHVIAPAVVMHYAIANGQTKPSLSTSDIDCGNYVITKSGTSICSKTKHTKLTSTTCAIVAPKANFGASKTTICLNESITFTDSSKGNLTAWSWSFDAGSSPSTANTQGPHTVSFSTSGTKTISLTITTSAGGTLTKNITVNVKADTKMKPNFTWMAAEKGKVTFTNTSNNSTANKWYFGNGDSATSANPIYNYIAGGTYNVKLRATNTCDTKDSTISIKLAYLNFYYLPKNPCLGDNVTFYDSSDNNVASWAWNLPSASTTTASGKGPHTVTYTAGGSKSATLNITVTGGQSQSQTINFNVVNVARTVPKFTWTAAEKGNVSFTNASTNGTSQKWFFGTGDSSILANPNYKYNAGGTYAVKIRSSNACNTKDSIVNIKLAYLNFYASPKTVCIGQPVTYTDSSDNNVASWVWTFTGASPASANVKGPHAVTYSSTGNKAATLNISVTGGQNQSYTINNAVNVSTDTFVKANFTYNNYGANLINFNNTSTGSNKTYKWYFGDGDSSTSKNPTHQYTNANNKTVKLVVKGTCNTDAITIQLRDFTSINNLNTAPLFEIYPNPSHSSFTIQGVYNTTLKVIVNDVSGKNITTETLKTGETIDCSKWSNGIYLVKIIANNNEQIVKIMIQH